MPSVQELIDEARSREICLDEATELQRWWTTWQREDEWDRRVYLGIAFNIGCAALGAFVGAVPGLIVGGLIGLAGNSAINAERNRRTRQAGDKLQRAIVALVDCLRAHNPT